MNTLPTGALDAAALAEFNDIANRHLRILEEHATEAEAAAWRQLDDEAAELRAQGEAFQRWLTAEQRHRETAAVLGRLRRQHLAAMPLARRIQADRAQRLAGGKP